MKKVLSSVITVSLILFLFAMPFFSENIGSAVKSGTEIATSHLIPSLFPFMFFSSLLLSLGGNVLSFIFSPFLCPLFGISKNAVPAVVAGFIGGFPGGAAYAAKLYAEGKISKSEAERLPVFSNNAGLMFTAGALGIGHFSSFKAGFMLYAFHIFSSVIAGILTRPRMINTIYKKTSSLSSSDISFSEVFPAVLKESIFSMALICGNFIIFKVICEFFYVLAGKSTAVLFLTGLLEVTGGVLSMPISKEGLILASFLLSFNGLCVHMQSMSFFAPLKLSVKKLFCGKIFSAFLSAFLMYITLPGNILQSKTLPSVLFYIFAIIIPTTFLIPAVPKKAKASVKN